MLIFINSFFFDAQEFEFTASCGKSELTTCADNKISQALNDKIEKLLPHYPRMTTHLSL